jgi:NAD kinase
LKRLRTQVIVNPESAKGRTRERWSHIQEGIRHFFQEFKYEFTENPLHATELTRAALKDGTELVMGVGGDGTMNEIANGFYENKKIIRIEAGPENRGMILLELGGEQPRTLPATFDRIPRSLLVKGYLQEIFRDKPLGLLSACQG